MATKYLSEINFEGTEYLIKDTEARNFITVLNDEKAPKASPTFTGEPKAPDTSDPSTNSQIITINDLTKTINDLALKEASKREVDTTPISGSKKLIESGGVYSVFQSVNNTIGILEEQITNKQFYVTVTEASGVYTADKTIEKILSALQNNKLLYCSYQVDGGEFILPLNINLTDENKIVFANDFLYDALAIAFDVNTSEIAVVNEKLAPENHTSETNQYGLGDATYYGHLKLSDTANQDLDSSKGVAASPKALSAIVTSLNNNIATRAPLISPAFTGDPTAPTPSDVTDNGTSIATTAFVQGAINNTLKITQTLQLKGVIDTTYTAPPEDSGDEDTYFPQLGLPTSCSPGEVYIAGCIGFCGYEKCEIGDLIICQLESSALDYDDPSIIDPYWTVVQTNLYAKFTEINNKFTEINNNFAEINKKTHALSDTIDGEALRSKAVSITRPDDILTAAASMPIRTEQIFFNGSDGVDAGGPADYIIVNAKKGDNHRTILDCYDLQTGNHYINGCMRAEANSTIEGANVWTGWKLQPSPNNTYTKTEVDTLIDQITGFTITPTLTDDNIVELTGSAKTNGFNLDAKHAKKGPSKVYTSENATTSISGYGTSKTIKIPQITVDTYGHVTAAADEDITITMPPTQTLPTSFNITANANDDDIVTLSASGGANSVSYTANHAQKGPNGGFVHENKAINFTIPNLTIDSYGHTTEAEKGQRFIIADELPNTITDGAICIVY